MSLNELLPVVGQLSHQDKLRLIHFLLLAVAKEEGCNLESTDVTNQENLLLKELVPQGGIQNSKFKIQNEDSVSVSLIWNGWFIYAVLY